MSTHITGAQIHKLFQVGVSGIPQQSRKIKKTMDTSIANQNQCGTWAVLANVFQPDWMLCFLSWLTHSWEWTVSHRMPRKPIQWGEEVLNPDNDLSGATEIKKYCILFRYMVSKRGGMSAPKCDIFRVFYEYWVSSAYVRYLHKCREAVMTFRGLGLNLFPLCKGWGHSSEALLASQGLPRLAAQLGHLPNLMRGSEELEEGSRKVQARKEQVGLCAAH